MMTVLGSLLLGSHLRYPSGSPSKDVYLFSASCGCAGSAWLGWFTQVGAEQDASKVATAIDKIHRGSKQK